MPMWAVVGRPGTFFNAGSNSKARMADGCALQLAGVKRECAGIVRGYRADSGHAGDVFDGGIFRSKIFGSQIRFDPKIRRAQGFAQIQYGQEFIPRLNAEDIKRSREKRLEEFPDFTEFEEARAASDRSRARAGHPGGLDPRALFAGPAFRIVGQRDSGRDATLSGRPGMAVEDDSGFAGAD